MLNLRLARPALLVDIARTRDLRGALEDGDAVTYGAAVTHADIEDGRVPDATPGWLRSAACHIAYRAVRNRGTIGGSLAHADPAADWVNIMTALGAMVLVSGPHGDRSYPWSNSSLDPTRQRSRRASWSRAFACCAGARKRSGAMRSSAERG